MEPLQEYIKEGEEMEEIDLQEQKGEEEELQGVEESHRGEEARGGRGRETRVRGWEPIGSNKRRCLHCGGEIAIGTCSHTSGNFVEVERRMKK